MYNMCNVLQIWLTVILLVFLIVCARQVLYKWPCNVCTSGTTLHVHNYCECTLITSRYGNAMWWNSTEERSALLCIRKSKLPTRVVSNENINVFTSIYDNFLTNSNSRTIKSYVEIWLYGVQPCFMLTNKLSLVSLSYNSIHKMLL